MLPFEMVVLGTPIAGQGSKKARRRWQNEINAVAREKAADGDLPESGPVVFRLAYFYLQSQAADLDNIVKVAQDALKMVAFVDDRQVVDLVVSARPKEGDYRINVTPELATGLAGHSDFIHIVVDHSTTFEAYR
ncbi:MAG TPA: RusA family crossover junction endodeoxyribonuclease [Thermoanaerobaculia bacterium]|nr:RusA family crossover junction endodeoxyribonuclease [Thermoanaerobaculia bacterium]